MNIVVACSFRPVFEAQSSIFQSSILFVQLRDRLENTSRYLSVIMSFTLEIFVFCANFVFFKLFITSSHLSSCNEIFFHKAMNHLQKQYRLCCNHKVLIVLVCHNVEDTI